MTLEIGPANLPDLVAGLGMLALAALLLWVAPTNRVHRAFALLQVVNSGVSLAYVGVVGFEQTDPSTSAVWFGIWNYYILAWPFAAAFFALRFLDPEGRSRVSRPLAWCLLGIVTMVLGAYALDHTLVAEERAEGTTVLGPLGVLWFTDPFTYGSMALLFALGARRAAAAPRRDGLVLASLAFVLAAILWSSAVLLPERYVMGSLTGHPVVLLLVRILPWAGVFTVLGTVVAILVAPPLRGDASTHRSRRLFGFGAALSTLTGVTTVWMLVQDPVAFERIPYVIDGVWRVIMTVLLAYALLRRQLFDVQARLRFAISRSTLAAAFVAAFFVTSEGAQIVFGQSNEWIGLLAAGALVFAIAPLQRAAERLAEKAVPVTGAPAYGRSSRSEATYRRMVRLALRDRRLTPEEEVELASMAHELGLSGPAAMRIRVEAERALERVGVHDDS